MIFSGESTAVHRVHSTFLACPKDAVVIAPGHTGNRSEDVSLTQCYKHQLPSSTCNIGFTLHIALSQTHTSIAFFSRTNEMAVIWGLDLREMQWGKFKNSYMWNKEYHLRRTKFIIYQIAMIFCVVSESLGTAALSGMLLSDPHII